jgi:acetolactate synthase-1/2/3 large subunit
MAENLSGGAALVAALLAHGAEIVFGIPGTHNLAVYTALRRYGLRHVTTRHEQGAGFAADGWARTRGRPGVCLVTTGPAVLNAATALAQAYSDSIPVLLVSPGLPLRHPSAGNGHLHEVKNQTGALDALLARSLRVTSVPEIPVAVAQAYATMTTGRPRPVHLEIPLDLLDERAPVRIAGPVRSGPPSPAVDDLAAATRLLATAHHPMIIAGGGCADAQAALRSFAEHVAAPVVTTANGKGALRADHPLAIGAGVHQPVVARLIEDSDVVVAVGTELAPSDFWSGPPRFTGQLIRIDIDPMAATTNATADVALVGDASEVLDALRERLTEGPRPVQERVAATRARFAAEARAEGHAYLRLTAALTQVLGEDGVVVGDSTMACYYGLLGNLPAHRPRSFLYPTGLGTLGYGLPAAIGAKLARPETPIVAVHGDGGIMFTVAELATAAQCGLPLPVVVVDNGGYGEIRAEMTARGDPPHAVDLDSPDFVLLARALGCHGVRVDEPDALAPALSAALRADRPTVIHLAEEAA